MIDVSALQLLLAVLTGWLDRQDRDVLRHLVEENRVLRQHLQGVLSHNSADGVRTADCGCVLTARFVKIGAQFDF